MPLNADDLPPDVRKRLGIKPTKTRTTRHEVGGSVHMRCHDCGQEFTKTTGPHGYEQHRTDTGHMRFACILEYAE